MKYIDNIWIMLLGVACLAPSCTKDPDTEFEVTKPDSMKGYEYLADYSSVKSYVADGFKIGAAVDAAEYNEKGAIYTLTNSNFNEVVASYHMKHDQVVKDDGTMDFTTVNNFVYNANQAGVDVFGHVLCWHNGQNSTYLNSAIEGEMVLKDDGSAAALAAKHGTLLHTSNAVSQIVSRATETSNWTDVMTDDFSTSEENNTYQVYNYDNGRGEYEISNEELVVKSLTAGNNWEPQLAFLLPSTSTIAVDEEWQLVMNVKSENSSSFQPIVQNSDGDALAYLANVSTSTTMTTVTIPITTSDTGIDDIVDYPVDKNLIGEQRLGTKVLFSLGETVDTFTFDNVKLQKKSAGGSSTDEWEVMVSEGDFASPGVNFNMANLGDSDSYDVVDDSNNKILEVVNVDTAPTWNPQFILLLGSYTMKDGETWKIEIKMKSGTGSPLYGAMEVQNSSNTHIGVGGDGENGYYNILPQTDYTVLTREFDVTTEELAGGDKIQLSLGSVEDTYYIDEFTIYRKGGEDTPVVPDNYHWFDELIKNGDLEEELDSSEGGKLKYGDYLLFQGEAVGTDAGSNSTTAAYVENTAGKGKLWDAQVVINPCIGTFKASDCFKVEFDVKSEKEQTIPTVISQRTYDDSYTSVYTGSAIKTTTEWVRHSIIFTNAATGCNFVMQFGNVVDKIYFDNISFKKGRFVPDGFEFVPYDEDQKIAKVREELKRWIDEMIAHTKGKVKVWDVINETILDEAPYDLRTTLNANSLVGDGYFYYADYLGENYVREVVKMARDAAGDEPLTLFINDYLLECPENGKLIELIKKIKAWEDDGVTKFDGIGTQMHVDFNSSPEYQAKQEAGVVGMFEKLAATDKLIRISEIDMGYSLNGSQVLTPDITEAQHKQMAQYYEFIVSEYFRIVPKEQQFGIAHWSMIDAPDTDGAWKRNEPTGLWSSDYTRKHTYGGFVEGLMSR